MRSFRKHTIMESPRLLRAGILTLLLSTCLRGADTLELPLGQPWLEHLRVRVDASSPNNPILSAGTYTSYGLLEALHTGGVTPSSGFDIVKIKDNWLILSFQLPRAHAASTQALVFQRGEALERGAYALRYYFPGAEMGETGDELLVHDLFKEDELTYFMSCRACNLELPHRIWPILTYTLAQDRLVPRRELTKRSYIINNLMWLKHRKQSLLDEAGMDDGYRKAYARNIVALYRSRFDEAECQRLFYQYYPAQDATELWQKIRPYLTTKLEIFQDRSREAEKATVRDEIIAQKSRTRPAAAHGPGPPPITQISKAPTSRVTGKSEQDGMRWPVTGFGLLAGLIMVYALQRRLRIGKQDGNARPGSGREEPRQSSQPLTLESARHLLKLPMEFTGDALDRAYRREIKKYHPDRFHEYADDFRAMSEAKSKALNEAYDMLKKHVSSE